MASVFLSPSTQEYNPYYSGGGSEEYYMNQLADIVQRYLEDSGINVVRNNPAGTVRDSVNQSNSGNFDVHVALHSNAAPPDLAGKLRGPDVYYYPTSGRGEALANIIVKNLKKIYPDPNLVNALPTRSLYEVRATRAPAVLIEVAYHDNPEDERWIIDNLNEIGKNIAQSIAEYLGVPFNV